MSRPESEASLDSSCHAMERRTHPSRDQKPGSLADRCRVNTVKKLQCPLLLPVFTILCVCWLALMKPNVLFISFPVFASSLGFRIVVNLISRGARGRETKKNFFLPPPPAGFLPSSIPASPPFFFTALTHTVKGIQNLKYYIVFACLESRRHTDVLKPEASLDAMRVLRMPHTITIKPRQLTLQRSERRSIDWDVASLSFPLRAGGKVFVLNEQETQNFFQRSSFLHFF